MAINKDGDVPLVGGFGDVDFGGNGSGKPAKANSRMSTLLFWQGRGKANMAPNGKNWIHAPDALVKGHVAYLVKFLGCTQVDQPKGIEVVKDAIKKLQFTQQLKKSETKDAAKCKKVEITISVDGVAIQEPRTNNIMYQFPLHRISYCADDKGVKKYFSFIAKGPADSNAADAVEKHECFVFVSTKLASEITLTIGQAFDLAYRRFLRDNGKYLELQKYLTLQNQKLEMQMKTYKTRLQELSKITYKDDLNAYLTRNNIAEITEFKPPAELEQQLSGISIINQMNLYKSLHAKDSDSTSYNSNGTANSSGDVENLLLATPPPMHNGRIRQNGKTDVTTNKNPAVGTKLEGLLLNSDSDSDFDPRAYEAESTPRYSTDSNPPPLLAPPPKSSKRHTALQTPQTATRTVNGSDLFGSAPFSTQPPTAQPPQMGQSPPPQTDHLSNLSNVTVKPNYDIADFNLQTSVFNGLTGYDPFDTQKVGGFFGANMNGFGLNDKQSVELDSGFNGFLDKTISEMKDGFSRGISFGNDDFSIETLDPLKKN